MYEEVYIHLYKFFWSVFWRIWTEYGDLLRKSSVFSPNARKYGQEKLHICTQCSLLCSKEIFKGLYTHKKLSKRFLLSRYYLQVCLRLKFKFLVRITLFLDVARDGNFQTLSEF